MRKTLAVGIQKHSLRCKGPALMGTPNPTRFGLVRVTGRAIGITCNIRELLCKRLLTDARRYLSPREMSLLQRVMS